MSTIRFPAVPHFNDPSESNICDHLTTIQVNKKKIGLNGEELERTRGVVFDSTTNKIFLIESWTKISLISIFSQSGELLYTLSTVHMKNPCGIAVDEDNIYVTDIHLHCIFHFKMVPYFHLVAIIGQKGTGHAEFNYPYQLAVSLHGDHGVFVTDCMNDRIKIINPLTSLQFLKYQKHISHDSMTKPCDVKLTPVCVYVLSSVDSPCVHVFSYTGEKIQSLITGGIGKQVVSPQCFCLEADENLLISDSRAHQVKIFSKEGTLLHTIGERGDGVGEFKFPEGIAIINIPKIAVVSQNKNYGLQIFSYL